jgi:hypothetical protein
VGPGSERTGEGLLLKEREQRESDTCQSQEGHLVLLGGPGSRGFRPGRRKQEVEKSVLLQDEELKRALCCWGMFVGRGARSERR